MHAFLLINSNPEEFAKKQGSKVIPFTLQKIEDARELKKFVKFSFSEKTAIIIENIDSATVEASNAFLKNLEEPNQNLIYILTANNLSNVLPTIISRCEIVRTTSDVLRVTSAGTKQFIELSTNQKIERVGKIKDRNEAIIFVEELLFYFDAELTRNPSLVTMCETCLQTIAALRANGNVGLQLTNLVARMNSHG